MKSVRIGERWVGPGQPCLIVAEAGVNHDGDPARARRLAEVAAECGADAVKFQTFEADQLVTEEAPKAGYQLRGTDPAESQRDMLRRLQLTREDNRELMRLCTERGILFLSTPFDEASADLLEELGVAAFKMASGELTNLGFLEYVAKKQRPLVVSTGMANLDEVAAATRVVKEAGCHDLILLHCVSCYPAAPADVNLRAMATLAERFGVPVGYSDHTLGVEVALAAVALGACLLEKHITLDRRAPGPDHSASLEPEDLRLLVSAIRTVESALGHGRKEPVPGEVDTARAARRSLVASRRIPAGTILTADLITVKRPGTGLPPAMRDAIIGRQTRVEIEAGKVITAEALR